MLALLSLAAFSQTPVSPDEQAIRKLMADQVDAWNRGSIDDFMKGYWQDDSLQFVGKSGVSYGYVNALRHYKQTYASPEQMGRLFFTLLKIQPLSPEYCFVTGKWFLKRTVGDIGGYYTLLFRKIEGQWKIVADHTSG